MLFDDALYDAGQSQGLTSQSSREKYVILLSVKAKEAIGFLEKYRFSRLETKDYKNVNKLTVVDRSQLEDLIKMVKLDPRCPKALEYMLPYSYCERLRLEQDKDFGGRKSYDICPRFYDLINECVGSVVFIDWTEEFCDELRRNGACG